jgi:hypothetical protein
MMSNKGMVSWDMIICSLVVASTMLIWFIGINVAHELQTFTSQKTVIVMLL